MRIISRREKAYSIVKSIFRAEAEIKMAVLEAKTRESKDFCGGGGNAYKSDPTAGKAMRELAAVRLVRLGDWIIYRPEEWLEVIRQTYKLTGERERELMRRYFKGDRIADMAVEGVGYSETTLHTIRRSFQQLAVEIACQLGLVKVVDI